MNFLYGAVLFIEEEIDEEEEEPFHEAYAERGLEGETRSEVLAVKESDGGDGRRSVEGTVDEHGENQAGEDEEEKKENEQFAMPTTRHSICMMTFRTMPVLGTGMTYVFPMGLVYLNVLVLGHQSLFFIIFTLPRLPVRLLFFF